MQRVYSTEFNIMSDLLLDLVNLNFHLQEKHKDKKECLSPISWVKEYCTVKFQNARQSGHSTAGRRLLLEYNGLFVVNKRSTIETYVNNFDIIPELVYTWNSFCSSNIDSKISKRLSKEDKNVIVVDMSEFLSKERKESIYNCIVELISLCKTKFCLVFLQ